MLLHSRARACCPCLPVSTTPAGAHSLRRVRKVFLNGSQTTLRVVRHDMSTRSVDVSNPLRGAPADEQRYGHFETFEVRCGGRPPHL